MQSVPQPLCAGLPLGPAQVDGVAPGSYQMRVWHATLTEGTPPVVLPLLVAGADVEQPVRLGQDGSAK